MEMLDFYFWNIIKISSKHYVIITGIFKWIVFETFLHNIEKISDKYSVNILGIFKHFIFETSLRNIENIFKQSVHTLETIKCHISEIFLWNIEKYFLKYSFMYS